MIYNYFIRLAKIVFLKISTNCGKQGNNRSFGSVDATD
ncbi:hypothetical protein NIASO_16125 [Niabella soli DSM 19437]|uniref:Uncharacterized protein n=1 Tax=Niabella soli DSM 19437 TaxID=929713 RepID=W0F4F1_9BACT|nr:hypothetical protein NIASO_16125 [Niabella soli DSM 19437]